MSAWRTNPRVARVSVRRSAEIAGLGLFSGREGRVVIEPADAGTGVVFRARDRQIPATIAHAVDVPPHPAMAAVGPRNTALGAADGGAVVQTVEHLLAALAGLGVTDAVIAVDGPEIPILDGSADGFARAIAEAGLETLDGSVSAIALAEPIEVRSDDGSAWVRVEPWDGDTPRAAYRYELAYEPPNPLGRQSAAWDGRADRFADDVAPARTYSFRSEAEAMAGLGLFASFTPADLLVVEDATGEPIENAWRFSDEAARHKLLDLIGDLALAGRPIAGVVTACRSGHALNRRMAGALAARAART